MKTDENYIKVYQTAYSDEYKQHAECYHSTSSDYAHRAALEAVAKHAVQSDGVKEKLVEAMIQNRAKLNSADNRFIIAKIVSAALAEAETKKDKCPNPNCEDGFVPDLHPGYEGTKPCPTCHGTGEKI